MLKSLLAAASFAALPLSTAPAQAAVNLVTNGDFETGSGTNVTGWTLDNIADSNSILILEGSDYIPCCGANGTTASLNNKFLSFGAGDSPNNPARLFQFVTTRPGSYLLSFDAAAIQGTQEIGYGVFDLTANSFAAFGSVTRSGGNNLDTLFQTFSRRFTTTGNITSIQFTDFSQTFSTDGFLDNVRITAIPEPGNWALMIGGFCLVGAGMRRRSQIPYSFG